MKYLTEVFLTQENVEENVWSKFLYAVSKLNGIFRKWKMYVYIENNKKSRGRRRKSFWRKISYIQMVFGNK